MKDCIAWRIFSVIIENTVIANTVVQLTPTSQSGVADALRLTFTATKALAGTVRISVGCAGAAENPALQAKARL